MRATSVAVAGRSPYPQQLARIGRFPASIATLNALPRSSTTPRYSATVRQRHSTPGSTSTIDSRARSSPGSTETPNGATPRPQLPMTSVVIPCRILLGTRGELSTATSEWPCESTKPGATTRPVQDAAGRRPWQVADRDDPVPGDPNVRTPRRAAAAVDHGPSGDQQVQGGAGVGSGDGVVPVMKRCHVSRPRAYRPQPWMVWATDGIQSRTAAGAVVRLYRPNSATPALFASVILPSSTSRLAWCTGHSVCTSMILSRATVAL